MANKYRLIVVSDIHHSTSKLRSLVPLINSSSIFVFCGDGVRDVENVSGSITVPMVCVRGNTDFGAMIEDRACFSAGETRAFVTHGHLYGVKSGISDLVAAARNNKCKLAFYGHTHCYKDVTVDGVHVICPGALLDGSYAVVEGDGTSFTCRQAFVE